MGNSNYLIWDIKEEPYGWVLGTLQGVDKPYQLTEGIPLTADFPDDVNYTLDPDFPHHTLPTDNLLNTRRLVIVSARLKGFLEQSMVPKVEYLQLAILDHKQKVASQDYFIVHTLDPIDCIDLDNSVVEWGMIDPNSIDSATRLVLDESRIDPQRTLFRAQRFSDLVFIRRDLAKAIDNMGFSGIMWTEINDYPGL